MFRATLGRYRRNRDHELDHPLNDHVRATTVVAGYSADYQRENKGDENTNCPNCKRLLIKARGEAWFESTYRPLVGKIAIGALLMTLVVLFALNGQVLLDRFDALLLVSVPLLLGFVIVVGYNLVVTRAFKLSYREAITTVIIGSSSHFEIAIATAVAMYGAGSMAALGTTMGLFWEVPIMLGLVYLGKALGRRGFWVVGAEPSIVARPLPEAPATPDPGRE